MEIEKSWEKFMRSGSVNHYLSFVNSRKEHEISEGNRDALYNRGFGNKGNERGRE